jgi:hypothetical protein
LTDASGRADDERTAVKVPSEGVRLLHTLVEPMNVVQAADGRSASGAEVALWSLLVVVAGAVPGLGLAVGVALSLTRLRGNRLARVLVPALGAVATVLWVLGLVAVDGGVDVGPAVPV